MWRRLAFWAEIIFISVLILVTRCSNYRDVFAGGQINFIDADCYARMTRARICFEHPGTIVRRHDFENFPIGTSPHTTAPLDYLIVAAATVLKPLSKNALDLAGAIVSPLLSIALGIFLCWWTRGMRIQFRWGVLILYAVSPILAHGFALGRPDHQSLLITLVTLALCAEWSLARSSDARSARSDALLRVQDTVRARHGTSPSDWRTGRALKRVPPYGNSKSWSIISGASWALALWVSFYEPLILLAVFASSRARSLMTRERRIGWIIFAVILALAFTIERRIPQWPKHELAGALKNWSGTIGELSYVSLGNPIWFAWCGWLLLLTPILLWRRGNIPSFLIALLVATFGLTMWQARWSYFFVMIFAMILPGILATLRKSLLAISVFTVSLFPIAQAWDRTLSDEEMARSAEKKTEEVELRALSLQIDGPFIAPWWLSPALSYWSEHPGVGGSSHESIRGTVETAKFFASQNTEEIAKSIERLNVTWIVVYNADRVAENSSRILGREVAQDAVAYLLDRHPREAPPFLELISQTGHFKLFRVFKS